MECGGMMEVGTMGAYPVTWWAALFIGVLVLGLIMRQALSPRARVLRHLRANRFGKAYRVAAGTGARKVVREYLARGLNLPAEVLRGPVLELFDHLVNLERSAADRRNRFVDAGFLDTVREEVGRAFSALWETCLNLEVVGAQNVQFDPGHERVRRVSGRLRSLSEASEVARVKLAELSLGAGRENAEEAGLALRVVGRQAEALLMMDEI